MNDAHLEPELIAVAIPPGSGPVTVREASSGTHEKAFLDFPFRLYGKDHRYWVPFLRMDQKNLFNLKKNPFFEHGEIQRFIAEQNGRVVGRIAAIRNGKHLETHKDGVGFFGFFECVDDQSVANALFEVAESWLKQKGLTAVRGPTNPTLNDTSGLLVNGFLREPFVLMPYNPPYYERLIAESGFERAMTMWAYYVHASRVNEAKFKRGVNIVYRRHPELTIRPLDKSRLKEEIGLALSIYNRAWEENWGNVPYTESEAMHLAKEVKPILDPDLFLFAELGGGTVGFSVSLPNANTALLHVKDGRLFPLGIPKLLARMSFGAVHELRMPLLGVLPEHQGKAFDAPLIYETIRTGRRKGYDACELSWVLDTNHVLINALEKLGAVRDKEYALFEKQLESEG